MKHIDWKKTAGSGRLISRARAEESSLEILVKLPPAAGERAISRAASVVVHFCSIGVPVSFAAPGLYVAAGTGLEFTRRILTILAKWDARAAPDTSGPLTAPSGRQVVTLELDESGDFVRRPSEAG
jgi:uncharacterized protein (DUF58 family)